MRPIRTPPVQYDVFKLQGGLDLVTPTLSLAPGVARDSINYEVSVTGGYSRVAGYERFDGRPSPNAAAYGVVTLDSVDGAAVGNTIQNLAGTVTGVVVAIVGLNLIYSKAVGSFTAGVTVYVGATPIGVVAATSSFTADAATQALYTALAADLYRADIGPVPGSGPVRGVAYLNGTTYAWRNNAGGTAMVIHKSSSSGWTAVSLGFELSFTTGTGSAIAVGDTVSNAAATATGVVARVVQETTGAWAGATGRLILSSTTGAWAAADQIRVGGVQRATASGAATAITLAASGRVETVLANMGGGSGATRLYGADGVNKGFEFDGTTYVPIRTGMAVDTPTHVAVHKNFLFLSFGGSVQWSGLGAPYVWSPVLGAGELVVSENVSNFLSMPGDASSAALAIFTKNTTHVLYGTSAATWSLVPFDRGTGAEAYTAQTLVDGYTLDDRGVVSLAAAQNFGNFDSSTLTFQIRPFVQLRRGRATASGINRERSQYRVFYNDGYALYITIVNGKMLGAMPVMFPDPVNCWCEGEAATGGGEVSFFGSTNGYVYRTDVGPDFDSAAISASVKLNFNPQGSSRVLKRYRRASLEITGSGYATFSFGYSLGYDSTDIDQASTSAYAVGFSAVNWDSFTWDNFVWDGRTLAPSEVDCNGTAENIAVLIASNSRYTQPFTVNSVVLHYTPRRGIR